MLAVCSPGDGPKKWIGSLISISLVPLNSIWLINSHLQGCQYCRLPGSMTHPFGAFDSSNCKRNSCAMLGVWGKKGIPSGMAWMVMPWPFYSIGPVPPLFTSSSGNCYLPHAKRLMTYAPFSLVHIPSFSSSFHWLWSRLFVFKRAYVELLLVAPWPT